MSVMGSAHRYACYGKPVPINFVRLVGLTHNCLENNSFGRHTAIYQAE